MGVARDRSSIRLETAIDERNFVLIISFCARDRGKLRRLEGCDRRESFIRDYIFLRSHQTLKASRGTFCTPDYIFCDRGLRRILEGCDCAPSAPIDYIFVLAEDVADLEAAIAERRQLLIIYGARRGTSSIRDYIFALAEYVADLADSGAATAFVEITESRNIEEHQLPFAITPYERPALAEHRSHLDIRAHFRRISDAIIVSA